MPMGSTKRYEILRFKFCPLLDFNVDMGTDDTLFVGAQTQHLGDMGLGGRSTWRLCSLKQGQAQFDVYVVFPK